MLVQVSLSLWAQACWKLRVQSVPRLQNISIFKMKLVYWYRYCKNTCLPGTMAAAHPSSPGEPGLRRDGAGWKGKGRPREPQNADGKELLETPGYQGRDRWQAGGAETGTPMGASDTMWPCSVLTQTPTPASHNSPTQSPSLLDYLLTYSPKCINSLLFSYLKKVGEEVRLLKCMFFCFHLPSHLWSQA